MHKINKETIDYRNQFAKDNYDRLNIQAPKGTKEPLKEYYKAQGHKSLNDYVMQLIKADLEQALAAVDVKTRQHADLALYNILKKEQTRNTDYIVKLEDGTTITIEKENRPE